MRSSAEVAADARARTLQHGRSGGHRGTGWLIADPVHDLDGNAYWPWVAWRKAERMEGTADSEDDARAAVRHFYHYGQD